MELVDGTNCGFVTTAPTSDPTGDDFFNADNNTNAGKYVTPSGAVKVTEIGWYTGTATEAADFDVGIYTHDSSPNNPKDLVGSSGDVAKGTGAG